MRHFSSAAAAVIALGALIPFGASGQGSLTVTNYQLVSETKISRTVSDFAYRADVVNTTGIARPSLTGTVTSSVATTQVIQGSLHFTNVPANGQVTSTDTFTIRVDRSVVFDFANLHWTFPPPGTQNPVANAGPDQSVAVGATVTLNGSASSNGGSGTLTYSWAFSSRPTGSNATLTNPTSVTPTFVADIAGAYAIVLTVNNGTASDTDSVTVNATGNTTPVANAGPDQTVALGATVALTGAGSTDADGNPLTYAWTIISKPAGSTATLTGANTVSPTFVADKSTIAPPPTNYVIQLIVNDGTINSNPDTVVISTSNSRPVANAGPPQTVTTIGAVVQLTGAGSTDADGNPLTYKWSLTTVPTGSTATLSSTTIVNPTFVADKAGTYVAQLIVNDGTIDSLPSMVTISDTPGAPAANAGPNQTVHQGITVNLSGSGSGGTGGPYTFQWSLTTKPANSTATLTNPTSATPTFVADQAGQYVAQLIVNDGSANSAPATVTITTTNTAPVANAGQNQTVQVGATVTLSGSGSSDADNDPITYSWSLTTKPAGSTATLSGATTVSPTFIADIAGTYVAQLIVSDPFQSSNPAATVTITAQNGGGISLPTVNLALGASAAFPVTLPTPSPAGTTVTLVITDATKASLSTLSVSIAAGATTPTTQPQVTGIGLGSTTVTASAPGYTGGTGNVNVTATATITPTPTTITGTATQNLTLTLSANAPTGGVTFNVSSSNTGVATVPATVTIAQGTTTVSIPVTGVAAGTTNISATAANVTVTPATVNVNAALTATITPTPTTIIGTATQNLTLTLSANAPTGGLTFNVSSSNTGVATVPATVTIAQNTTTVSIPVTGVSAGATTISATATDVTVTPATVNVVTGLAFTTTGALPNGTIGVPYSQTLGIVGGTGPFTFVINSGTLPAGLNLNASTGAIAGTPNGTAPSDSSLTFKVTDSSTPTAQTATSATITIHINLGAAASITATSGAPQSATINTQFAAPLVATVKDAGGNPVPNVAVTFTAPAGTGTFAGGGVTNTVNTNASGAATSALFTAGGTAGSFNVTANVAPPLATAATFTLTNLGPATITATGGTPQNAPGGGQFAPLQATVKDTGNNPVPNVAVTFTAPAGTGTFAGGGVTNTVNTSASGVATSAVFTASGTAGSYSVTANVAPPLATPATFTLTNVVIVAPPDSVIATSGTPQSAFVNAAFSAPFVATVKDAANNSLPGVVVTFIVNPAGGGAGGTFANGTDTTTATTDASGVATSSVLTANGTGGSFFVAASAPGVEQAKTARFDLANAPIFQNVAPPTLGDVSIGQNLEAPLTLTLPSPAPAGGAQVFVTSLNPALVRLGGAFAAGTAQVVLPIPEGSTTVVGLFAQSMAASGTVQLSIAVNGYGNSTATATLTPSGFILTPPAGPGTPSFVTTINSDVTLTVSAARLDPSLNFVEVQQLRGPATFSATIPVSTSDNTKGTVNPTSVTINGGETSANTTFHAAGAGNVDITAGTPAGYSTPANGGNLTTNKLTATIGGKLITAGPAVTVGQNLEEISSFTFTPAEPFTVFTITSNDPSKFLLSLTPNGDGASSITFDTGMNNGRIGSPPFFVYGLTNSGSATYTMSASGYSNATGTVNFAPSGFVIIAPFGIGQPFSTTSGAANTELTISSRILDGNLTPQAVRGGITVNVPVTSSNTSVGTITTSPVVFTGGLAGVNTQFHPVGNGTTVISLTAPNGFGTPATGSTVQVNVSTPGCRVSDQVTVGKGLQTTGTLFLGQAAPAAGLTVTLTSNSPNLRLSLSPTAAGTGSIVINIPGGGLNATYFIQSTTDTASGTHTCTATGYTAGTGTVFFAPSGVVIYGPFGLNSPFPLTTTVANGPVAFSVSTTILAGGSLAATDQFQDLAGGSSLSIALTNSNPGVGTVPTPVTINGGSNTVNPLFTPLSVGNTTISVIKPAAFSQPADNTTLQIRVNP